MTRVDLGASGTFASGIADTFARMTGTAIGSSTQAAQSQWRSMAERQDLAHLGAFWRRAIPLAIAGWVVWVPFDALLAWGMYPGTFLRSLAIRAVLGVGMLLSLVRVSRARSYAEMTAWLVLLALFVNGTIAAVGARFGGIASPYHPGSLVVLAVLGFSPLPWRRVLPVALAGTFVYPAVILALAPREQLHHAVPLVPLLATTMMGLIIAGLACIGANTAWTLRQQVFESRSIGRYDLKRRIGAGGMGEVWAAWHRGLKREVALKILRAAAGDEAAAQRFEREVQAMTELTHPNTVRVFDFGVTDDGLTYYAMELLQGENFVELVTRVGPLPPARAVYLVAQAARALAEAHGRAMVHRDVKPENLFVTHAGVEADLVKVLDFGIVRRETDGVAEAHLTKTGAIAGTPAYIAPEVVRGETATARADVYALGGVLYFLLTGKPPFEGQSLVALLMAHVSEPVVPPSRLAKYPVPEDLEALVLRCLAKSPDERPADAREVADLLGRGSLAGAWTPSLDADKAPPSGEQSAVAFEPTMEIRRDG